MSDSRASAAMERLPWLDDEPKGSTGKPWTGVLRWGPVLALAAMLLAGSAYWLGRTTGGALPDSISAPDRDLPAATMILPEPQPQPQPEATTAPTAAPKPEEAVRGASSRSPARPPAVVRHGRVDIRHHAVPPPPPTAVVTPQPTLQYWPALTSAGAAGRMVRIGTFASRISAKKGWRALTAVYPGIKRIPAAVVAIVSARDGKTYYRLQMGTTSQAHSEVLCQRMRIIGQSCIVVGLGEVSA